MKRMLIAATLSTTLLTGSAFAQSYVGLGAGSAKTNTDETSWKLYGGYQFSKNWGVELGYNDLGRSRGSDIESWSLAATGTFPLNDSWALIGKLGATSNRSNNSGSSSRSEALVGVGIAYTISKNVGLRLEYEDFGKFPKNNSGNESNASNLALSVKYAF